MKGNLKNQQHQGQQSTNSGYPAPAQPNQYLQHHPHHLNQAKNMNRLAFTANNFYDSRNMLSGVQHYGMRPSNEIGPNTGVPNANSNGQAMPRQSRSRQKMMKTNTYGVMNQYNSPGQIQHQNSFGNGVGHGPGGAANMNSLNSNPYDNAAGLPMAAASDLYG